MDKLTNLLQKIDGRGYKAYKTIQGQYQFDQFTLHIDHVQGDPFAAPSRISVQVPLVDCGFSPALFNTATRKLAFEDFMSRAVANAIKKYARGRRGTGKSGDIHIAANQQQILQRNALIATDHYLEARLTMGLPAQGRSVAGNDAHAMLLEELPNIVAHSLFYQSIDPLALTKHIECIEDQAYLHTWLRENKQVAFIADNAILARRSSIDERPLTERAIPFYSPNTLACQVDLPHAGKIRGMAIPEGITLIVGGGFHGKSTLLHALEKAVYFHKPGDGREYIATQAGAVKIRAEDGRVINNVNISPFINNLPFNKDTQMFSTENASGSTSQSANIIEALDCGAQLLLIDEDTSATNFMIRDQRIQALVSKAQEPITPLIQRIRELYENYGISSIIVTGGSGDYLEVSDTVILMEAYSAKDMTHVAHQIAPPKQQQLGQSRQPGQLPVFEKSTHRKPNRQQLIPARGNKPIKIDARETKSLIYGIHEIDLTKVEQLVDSGQTQTIGWFILYYLEKYHDKSQNLVYGLQQAIDDAHSQGLDIIHPYKVGSLALPRLHEIAAAINRIRLDC